MARDVRSHERDDNCFSGLFTSCIMTYVRMKKASPLLQTNRSALETRKIRFKDKTKEKIEPKMMTYVRLKR